MGLNSKARLLVGLLATGSLGVLIAVVVLLNAALADIAAKSDQLETERTYELVDAAIQGQIARVSGMATDNSWWNAAVTSLYTPTIDTEWAAENWAPGAQEDKPYDGIFVLDESGRTVWATFRGKRFTEDSASALGSGFRAIFRSERANIDLGQAPYSGLTLTRFGPAIVSVSLIRPADAPFKKLGKMRRYMVMTRHLTPELVTSVGKSLKLKWFRIADADDNSPSSFTLKGADGKPVAELIWKPHYTGHVAVGAGRFQTGQIMLLVGCLVATLVVLAGYTVHKLATSEGEARQVSLTDALSQLPNRRAFYERLEVLGRREACLVSIVFIDLDGFKHINDLYGHNLGDQLIRQIATRLTVLVPPGGMLARMGGDEFAMLLDGPSSEPKALRFSQDVLSALASPVRIDERQLKPGASLGVATADLATVSVQEVLRRADVAMYHAKETGKARIVLYRKDLDNRRLRREEIEGGIKLGLERGEFDVVYQPIVDARTHAVTGVEALIRWPRRPEGILLPAQFIPIAEESGLIQDLGLFVLERACRDLADRPDLTLSVNVSPVQFHDMDFEVRIVDILAGVGFPASRLELEVTESHLIDNPERAIHVVSRLRSIGIRFALDDFGTGYSSIGYLKRFRFDRIKIDKSMASAVDLDPQAGALVSGTVHIARALSMAITAEGVESEQLAKVLRLAGCTSLQGYYFGKPASLAELPPPAVQPVSIARNG